ncbi:MAG TPA: hypothetical protein VGM86_05160 [Thermoanaerobaculia bacterium]|jgi:hypothetical protein
MKRNRILGRILAKELKPEELGLVSGSDTVVVAAARTTDSLAASAGDDPTGPPVSTLVATLPDYHEDQ